MALLRVFERKPGHSALSFVNSLRKKVFQLFKDTTLWHIGHRGVNVEFEYLREKSSKFVTALGHLYWDQEEVFGGENGL